MDRITRARRATGPQARLQEGNFLIKEGSTHGNYASDFIHPFFLCYDPSFSSALPYKAHKV
jgi:hypothetical protein